MKSLSILLLTAVILILSAGNAISDDPTEEWVARYNGPADNWDNAYAIILDDTGNIYVTGSSNDEYTTIKYNTDGVQQWVARYNGPGNESDAATSIVVDDAGNVYVTGRSFGDGTDYDYVTVKYNSDGIQQWVARYNGPGNFTDIAYTIALDSDGNVYVTGFSDGTYRDYTTIKYNPDGLELWVARYNGPDNTEDTASDIALDDESNVYVTGMSHGIGIGNDYTTIKYNSDGVQEWVARYNGPENSHDEAYAIVLDDSGTVNVTGCSWGDHWDYVTIQYNSEGLEQWVARYNGPGNKGDAASDIELDDEGNIYVTGMSYSDSTYNDYTTIKYNTDGVQQWVARYNGPGNLTDKAYDITLDEDGNIYVTGISRGFNTNDDYATVKYNTDGAEQWVARYNGPGNGIGAAQAVAADRIGNIYVTGYSTGSNNYTDYATIKYSQTVGAAPPHEVESGALQLFPITPNPSEDIFTISFYKPDASEVIVEIYDIAGKLVSEISEGALGPGFHQLQVGYLQPGVYFCHLQVGSLSLTEKLVVMQ